MIKHCCLKSFCFIQIQDLYFLKLILPFTDPIMAKARKKRITGPALAINVGLDHPGLVQVGDPVYAVISSSTWFVFLIVLIKEFVVLIVLIHDHPGFVQVGDQSLVQHWRSIVVWIILVLFKSGIQCMLWYISNKVQLDFLF